MKHVFGIEHELTQEETEAVSGGSLLSRISDRFRRPCQVKPPVYTTLALGEEGGDGGPVTRAAFEDGGGGGDMTTMAIGEEGGGGLF